MSIARLLRALALALALVASSGAPVAAVEIELFDPDTYGPVGTPPTISPGDGGAWVRWLQEELAGAGFRPGEIDGTYGGASLGAVYAFQKLHDLPRDGVFLPEYWDLLEERPLIPPDPVAPDRLEVDLGRQILYVIEDQEVEAVLPVSSGNGDTYRNASGRRVRARTPEGAFRFYRHIDGWRISYLGALYRPYYFRGGYAIHGSRSVPPYPASHGCVRVEMWDMDYLTTRVGIDLPVYIYGQRLTRDEVVPPPGSALPDPFKPRAWRAIA